MALRSIVGPHVGTAVGGGVVSLDFDLVFFDTTNNSVIVQERIRVTLNGSETVAQISSAIGAAARSKATALGLGTIAANEVVIPSPAKA